MFEFLQTSGSSYKNQEASSYLALAYLTDLRPQVHVVVLGFGLTYSYLLSYTM